MTAISEETYRASHEMMDMRGYDFEFDIDVKGHSTRLSEEDRNPSSLEWTMWMKTDDLAKAVEYTKANGFPFPEVPANELNTLKMRCQFCEHQDYRTDGERIWATEECPYKDGFPSVKASISIPSGRMMVGNDLRDVFDIEEDHYVNEAIGIKKTVEDFAKIGALHFMVGNSCPSLYKTGTDQFTVSASGYDSNTDTDVEIEGEVVATVITDLWWVTCVDGDEYDKRGCKAPCTEVLVTPGEYELDYTFLRKNWSFEYGPTPNVYATIRRKY